ncbi:MAG: cysteine methyltransferase [Tenericutes bacterium HGW-Tenericutes-2]|jgi:O-6-methylguanine DNA methyltransferase|nr:MAG: cysteine methyltransferase [Tenericutes bacterium HGW-Tenericutes-2]
MYHKYVSLLGVITYQVKEGFLVSMTIDDLDVEIENNEKSKKIDKTLDMYFNNKLKNFNIPLAFEKGTPFQKQVWNELLKIPYGESRSYQDIANLIDNPKAVRAVGQACKKNPIGIVVPCHRVIGKDGSLTGYSGKNYTHIKKILLDHEKKNEEKA